jgi:hypothetical protein
MARPYRRSAATSVGPRSSMTIVALRNLVQAAVKAGPAWTPATSGSRDVPGPGAPRALACVVTGWAPPPQPVISAAATAAITVSFVFRTVPASPSAALASGRARACADRHDAVAIAANSQAAPSGKPYGAKQTSPRRYKYLPAILVPAGPSHGPPFTAAGLRRMRMSRG